tara:strand:+ start:27047 stop:28831 length:1785 start_codon:yes stop_codon:yes gene_type:complete
MRFLNIWAGGFLCFLSGCGNGGSENTLPLLSFDVPITVNEQTIGTLVSTSTDPDGDFLKHEWTQLSGTIVSLTVINETSVEFLVPDVSNDEDVQFSLRVSDARGGIVVDNNIFIQLVASLADKSNITDAEIVLNASDQSPFIGELNIAGDLSQVSNIHVSVLSKVGASASPFLTTFESGDLISNSGAMSLPFIGLYDNFINNVEILLIYADESILKFEKEIETVKFNSPYTVEVVHTVNPNLRPEFSFLYLQSPSTGPTILDVDGYFRWVQLPKEPLLDSEAGISGQAVLYDNGKFIVAVEDQIGSIALDGRSSFVEIKSSNMTKIHVHHDLDFGRSGYLVEIDATYLDSDTRIIESILIDVNLEGKIFKAWDFGSILSDYMTKNGDDPSNFVRDGYDWFHMNSAIYDEANNLIIASSRENFVIAIDYDTNEIKWLFGDETKHWYVNFASLRNLSLSSIDIKPMGQHALSLDNGNLLMFNNGQKSFQQPQGVPVGGTLETSPVSSYQIDEEAQSASLIWSYDAGIYSDICSSVYKFKESKDYLIMYTSAGRLNKDEPYFAVMQAINKSKNVLFEFKLSQVNPFCGTAFQAAPLM